jgi:hypothetical protein
LLVGLASAFTAPPLAVKPPLVLTPPVVVKPPVAALPPLEVIPPAVAIPPEAFTPPVAGAPPERATLESGWLTGELVLEQFPMVAATSSSPERCRTRTPRGKVADGTLKWEFGMDRYLLGHR